MKESDTTEAQRGQRKQIYRWGEADCERMEGFMMINQLTEMVIGAAIEVHRHLGPGLMESAYRHCLCHELRSRSIAIVTEQPLPVTYKGMKLDCGYRTDVLVENQILLELKCVEKIIPIHEAQLLTYLRLGGWKIGLLINFNVPTLKHGIKRMVLGSIDE